MTRTQVREYFPAVHALIEEAHDAHPLWIALNTISAVDATSAQVTLMPTMERMADFVSTSDHGHAFRQRVLHASSHEELLHALSMLYVAHIYRAHNPSFLHDNRHMHLSVSIGNETVALGIVRPSVRGAQTLQLHSELRGVEDILHAVRSHVRGMQRHEKAQHHVCVVFSSQPSIQNELALKTYIQTHRQQMVDDFPHLSGIILAHTAPDVIHREEATYIPFHTEHSEVEWMLTKES